MMIEMLQLHTLRDVNRNDILLIKLLPSGEGRKKEKAKKKKKESEVLT